MRLLHYKHRSGGKPCVTFGTRRQLLVCFGFFFFVKVSVSLSSSSSVPGSVCWGKSAPCVHETLMLWPPFVCEVWCGIHGEGGKTKAGLTPPERESACMWSFCMPPFKECCVQVFIEMSSPWAVHDMYDGHTYKSAAEWAEDKKKKKMSQGSHTCGRNKHVPLQMLLSPLGPDFTTSTICLSYDLFSFLAFDSTGSVSYLRRMETSS